MGVVVPTLQVGSVSREATERGYSFVGSSSRLDQASGDFEEALNAIMNLAAAEERARKVASELEKTKRRVSALDNVIVPRLQGSIRLIEDKLEELERENFSRLKKIKAILVARAE
jgi:V/A-type H+-transporting ATPase subunit D